jgi:hypothetical protein
MRFPDITLNYPNGKKAVEVVGVDGNIMEHIRLGSALINIGLKQVPKLQPLINDFYDIYTKVNNL